MIYEQVVVTPREFAVIERAAQGMSIDQTAESLNLSSGTVKVYRSRIYDKLGLSRGNQAVALTNYYRSGKITVERRKPWDIKKNGKLRPDGRFC